MRSFGHPVKAVAETEVGRAAPRVRVFSAAQLSNAPSPMKLALGKAALARALHPLNALLPMVIASGKLIVSRFLQSSNAYEFTCFAPGKLALTREVQL